MSQLDDLLHALLGTPAPPARYTIGGKPLRCLHCDNDVFLRRRVAARGPLAYALTCNACGLAAWFDRPPEDQKGE